MQIGELTDIGEVGTDEGKCSSCPIDISEVSTLGSHGAWASLLWVMEDVGNVSFTVARRFLLDKQMENLSLIVAPRLDMPR